MFTRRINELLFKPVDGINISVFRVLFGIIMAWQFMLFREIFADIAADTIFYLPYAHLPFIKPLPEPWFNLSFIAFTVVSLLFAAGIKPRLMAALMFAGVFYYFHIEETIYNNHYYLYILICFLLIFVDYPSQLAAFSAKKEATSVPYWQLLMLQLQLFVAYFFGGVAKLNSEWLFYAEPVRTWLPDMLGLNVYSMLSEQARIFVAYFITYSGLILDLVAGAMLLYKGTRKYIIPFLLFFHISNSIMFNIGTFPYFGIISLVLFLDAEWIYKAINVLGVKTAQKAKKVVAYNSSLFVACCLCIYFLFQFTFPLRHLLIPGWVIWDERGYKFSWFMKLRSKESIVALKVNIDNDPVNYYINLNDYKITKKQFKYIFTKPNIAIKFSKLLEKEIKARNGIQEDIKIYPEFYVKLNSYNYQLLLDTSVDLTAQNESIFDLKSQDWIRPFNRNAPPFDYNNPLKSAYAVKDEFDD